jgi:succinate dehydrogenase / fumarate reductase flavoprotein subunit
VYRRALEPYLTPYNPSMPGAMDVTVRRCGVLVIGSGGAGLRAAIAAAQSGADTLIVGKRGRSDAHTVLAAGGINAALGTVDPQDSWEQHFADTVRESYFLAHPHVAELLAKEAPAAVQELAEWGCGFARTPDGRLDQRYFGAHTYRRTCYAGDHTGRDMIGTLVDRVRALDVPIQEHQYVTRLLTKGSDCLGAFAFDVRSGARTAFIADAVILATGGHTSLWRTNTSRADENWGEGMSLALRAGCRLMDMELVQFHPTGIVAPPDVAGTLVTEAVRGEGGRLSNALGERFMERYDPIRMELSTRDRVALANYTEIIEGRAGPHGGVFLDISHRGKDYIMEKLPTMYRQFLSFQGLDISKDPMEVAPTAHYSMGGIAVEPETHATDVAKLFAAGECASGLHGANRLGGNSLVDIMVFGRRAGEAAAVLSARTRARPSPSVPVKEAEEELDAGLGPGSNAVGELQTSIRDVMWRRAGVVRDEAGLEAGVREIEELRRAALDVDVPAGAGGWLELARALDLRAGLDTGEATVRCAVERRETRGCHNRSDFPRLDLALARNFFTARDPGTGTLELSSQPVPQMPEELAAWVAASRVDVQETERLLE